MRGEHGWRLRQCRRQSGSSPRARGTLRVRHRQGLGVRFIPACAGNTVSGSSISRALSVHPRVRGEHASLLNGCFVESGSSPRARGTRTRCGRLPAGGWFIPACAGNTLLVHPIVQRKYGSSPRARGTRRFLRHHDGQGRFIPACAGNTSGRCAPCRWYTVHPRVRGEHIRVLASPGDMDGSSPRARGTPAGWLIGCYLNRFIPACAGNTCAPSILHDRASVHPRVRGEHFRHGDDTPGPIGSSPRARGTRFLLCGQFGMVRFIPACAGNTVRQMTIDRMHAGSSPRARGTQVACGGNVDHRRFIPACAGNTLRLRF